MFFWLMMEKVMFHRPDDNSINVLCIEYSDMIRMYLVDGNQPFLAAIKQYQEVIAGNITY